MSSKKFSEKDFLNIIDKAPLVSIDLVIENPEGKILLGRRNNKPAQGYWFVPGGRIRKNETLAQAMTRISKTELGFEINLHEARLIGAYDHIYDDNFANAQDINTHYVALGHHYKLKDHDHIQIDEQHDEVNWFDKDTLINHEQVHKNTRAYFINSNQGYN